MEYNKNSLLALWSEKTGKTIAKIEVEDEMTYPIIKLMEVLGFKQWKHEKTVEWLNGNDFINDDTMEYLTHKLKDMVSINRSDIIWVNELEISANIDCEIETEPSDWAYWSSDVEQYVSCNKDVFKYFSLNDTISFDLLEPLEDVEGLKDIYTFEETVEGDIDIGEVMFEFKNNHLQNKEIAFSWRNGETLLEHLKNWAEKLTNLNCKFSTLKLA